MNSQIEKHYLYTISRKDIPIAQQAIQAGHAAIEYAYEHGRPPDGHPSYIHLSVKKKEDLESLIEYLKENDIKFSFFEEPYMNWGLTAIACCLPESKKHILKHLPLWKPKSE